MTVTKITALHRAQMLRRDVEALNKDVRESLSTMTLMEAREIRAEVEHTEEWLVGIRKLLS